MPNSSHPHGRLILATLLFFVAIGWGVVFPIASQSESVQNRLQSYRAAGINPSAVFYSDHPGTRDIESRMANRVESSESFWRWPCIFETPDQNVSHTSFSFGDKSTGDARD